MPNRRPEPGETWGILGGAFDPVHLGHLTLAREVAQATRLTGVLFVPSYQPPHRHVEFAAGWEDRVSMLQLALQDESSFLSETIEKALPAPGYTLRVVQGLKAKYPGISFSLIVGADNLSRFAGWHQPVQILNEAVLLVGSRPGSLPEVPAGLPHSRVRVLGTSEIAVSASAIRSAVGTGIWLDELSRLTPEPVARYILSHGLYQ